MKPLSVIKGLTFLALRSLFFFFFFLSPLLRLPEQDKHSGKHCTVGKYSRTSALMNLTWLPSLNGQKWARRAGGSRGFCTLTPASIQIKRWQKAVGVGSRAPLIKQWSWLLQEAPISHWRLGTVRRSHMGLCLSVSIMACTLSYSGVGSDSLGSLQSTSQLK